MAIVSPKARRTTRSKLSDGFKKNGIEIRHALNGGEQKIHGHNVDGYRPESQTIFEFHESNWHGCQTHFPDRNIKNGHTTV